MRALYDRDDSVTESGQNANFPRPNLLAAKQNRLPPMHVFSRRTNIVTRGDGLQYLDPFVLRLLLLLGTSKFDLYDCICAGRDWRTGHNAHSRSIFDCMVGDVPGGNCAGDAKACGLPIARLAILAA